MTVAKLARLAPSLGVNVRHLAPYRRVWLGCSVRIFLLVLWHGAQQTDCMRSDTVPGINDILSMIHNRRKRDTYIIGGLIGLCLFFLLRYIFW
jgi:hypothetical protein